MATNREENVGSEVDGETSNEQCKICVNDVKDICFVGDYNGRCYPAHRSLLVSASGYFRDHFIRNPDTDSFEPVYITDVEPIALVHCLDFIYTGYLDVTTKNLRNFAEAALVLKMDAVWDCCVAYAVTHVDIDTFFDLRMMAASTCCQKLLDATEMFALCNFELLMGHEEFALIDKTLLVFLLEHKKLKMIPERKVYEAVIAWINFIPSKRKHHLGELLKLVELEQIPIDYLKDVVYAEPLVTQDSGCRNLLEDALFSHIQPAVSAEDGSAMLTQESMVFLDQNLRSVRAYNPWSGRWRNFTKFGENDQKFTAVSIERSVYVLCEDRQVFALDTENNKWREMAIMGTERADPRATALDGMIYLSGGTVAATGKGMRTAERFDPKTNTWEKLQSMKKPRTKHCLAASRGLVYAIGGLNNNNTAVKLVERIVPKQGVWMNVAPLKKPRSGAQCAVKDEAIYIIGGTFTPDVSIEMLNSTGSGWVTINVAIPRNFIAACAIGEDIYLLCNSDVTNNNEFEIQMLQLDGEQPVHVEKVKNVDDFCSMAVVSS